MTILTPEIIEKAAEVAEVAIWDQSGNDPAPFAIRVARAALEASLPDILERAAKECDDAVKHAKEKGDRAMLAAALATDLARIIRSLQTKDNGNG